jgi:HAD superfamily hydrolase (TIGR01549 family)
MAVPIEAVIFDVDGVLIDSLSQHLQACRDIAAEFGLALEIPSEDEFRRMVAAGQKVSPMLNFFLAVGFPPGEAERATLVYEKEFSRRYRLSLFEGVEEMLARLCAAGLQLGLVTSNTRSNVLPVLGDARKYFDPSGLFFLDSEPGPREKFWYLERCAQALARSSASCIYVGDQPADIFAAQKAGLQFLGVAYGWGLVEASNDFAIVRNVEGLTEKLLERASARAIR